MADKPLPGVLFHFTCEDRYPMILRSGELVPGPHGFVWLTDLEVPIRDALGLTSQILSCDRTAHRVSVDTVRLAVGRGQRIDWWPTIRRELLRGGAGARVREWIADLEEVDGARPAHWWVSLESLPIREGAR